VAAICQQAEDRDNSFVRGVDSYMALRRGTVGAQPTFDLLLLAMEIPDEKLDDPKIVELELLATDMIILANVSPFCSVFPRIPSLTPHGYARMFTPTTSSSLEAMMDTTWYPSQWVPGSCPSKERWIT